MPHASNYLQAAFEREREIPALRQTAAKPQGEEMCSWWLIRLHLHKWSGIFFDAVRRPSLPLDYLGWFVAQFWPRLNCDSCR